MARDPRYDILFEPVRIGPVTAKNRFYQVPHTNGSGNRLPHIAAAMRGMKAQGGLGGARRCLRQAGNFEARRRRRSVHEPRHHGVDDQARRARSHRRRTSLDRGSVSAQEDRGGTTRGHPGVYRLQHLCRLGHPGGSHPLHAEPKHIGGMAPRLASGKDAPARHRREGAGDRRRSRGTRGGTGLRAPRGHCAAREHRAHTPRSPCSGDSTTRFAILRSKTARFTNPVRNSGQGRASDIETCTNAPVGGYLWRAARACSPRRQRAARFSGLAEPWVR